MSKAVLTKTEYRGWSSFASVTLRALVALLLLAAIPACGGEAEEAPAEREAQFDGLTPDEMQRQAASMTPEQAESLGIMDTTITVGAPIGADSVVQPGVITGAPADSAPGPRQ